MDGPDDQPSGDNAAFGLERDPARVIAFSDGVTAIAVTLLVLEIRVPDDTRHLWHELGDLWPSYLAYGVTFMLIGQIWANHHVMFDHIRRVDRLVLFLNTVLMMDLAFMPFTAAVLARAFRDGQAEATAVSLFGAAFLFAAVLFNLIWWHARRESNILADTLHPDGIKAIARRFQLALVWLTVGTATGAVVPVLGVAVLTAFIPYYWLPIAGELPRTARRRTPGAGR